jgi:S-adenosylmethionine hydrolase
VAPAEFGPEISDYIRLPLPAVEQIGENSLRGVVLKVDKFGNLITNLSEQEAPTLFATTPPRIKLLIAGQTITRLCHSYAEGGDDEFFAIIGSSGYLEIAARQASAADKLSAGVGTPVGLLLET